MKRIVIPEFGRIYRKDRPLNSDTHENRIYLNASLYKKLQRTDRQLSRDGQEIFTWYANHVQARQWVGVIQLPGLLIEILPKVDTLVTTDSQFYEKAKTHEARKNLLYMLAIAGEVPVRSRDLAKLTSRKAPLSETLISTLATRLLAEILKGTDRSYVYKKDNMRCFKGRLIINRHLLKNTGHRERFYCLYDELSEDTPLNQLFKSVCRTLLDVTKTPATQDRLRNCLLIFDEVSDNPNPQRSIDRVVLNRQNERFDDLYNFCRLVLSRHAPTVSVGREKSFSLLFDMNKVFERFIAAFIQKQIMPDLPGYRLFPQAKRNRRHLLQSPAGKGVLRLEPDILIRSPKGHFQVIDTKWKNLSGAAGKTYSGANRSDLYQLFAYSERYGCSKSILLYPKVPGISEFYLNIIDNNGRASGSKIGVSFVNINRDLHLPIERQMLAAELKQIVLEGFLIECDALNAENQDNNTVGGTA